MDAGSASQSSGGNHGTLRADVSKRQTFLPLSGGNGVSWTGEAREVPDDSPHLEGVDGIPASPSHFSPLFSSCD